MAVPLGLVLVAVERVSSGPWIPLLAVFPAGAVYLGAVVRLGLVTREEVTRMFRRRPAS